MGASNSKPHTVEMENTMPFQISQDVAARINKATKMNEAENSATTAAPIKSTVTHSLGSGQHYCENCSRTTTNISASMGTGIEACVAGPYSRSSADAAVDPSACASKPNQTVAPVALVAWQKQSIEIEESQFDQTLDRINKLFGEPVKWAQECSGDISDMEKRLAVCYRDYPHEPLQCAKLAEQYHSFVFNKQLDVMTKSGTVDKDAKSKESTSAGEPGPRG
ncbi:uncharacterized protein Dwil_GK10053 [Drosophila willistoni]|uniref:Uncharacterized protein n=1 Tax=Drosophila willistoni TaxID=7260 RepID=B4NCJ8_DROWI|nr:uncharacterized protein LOC6649028 [Drosophila willistoni]EDW82557.1 uncharacterized protein Dwil_GK10053 [Drosophila willistoni]